VFAVSRARAAPTVVIADTRDAPVLPTLTSEVEVHVAGRAVVQTLAARDADPLTYATHATELVASGQAAIVVWVAPVDGGFLVLASGGWPGRALIELVRIEASVGTAEIERTIALKIAGLLDTLLAPHVDVQAMVGISTGPSVRTSTAPRTGAWRLAIEGLVAHESHERAFDGRVGIGVGRTWRFGDLSIVPMLAGSWQPSSAIENARGRASITEVDGTVGVDAATELGPIQIFARPHAIGGLLVVRGSSADGRHGDARVFAPYAGLDVGVRRAVSESAWLGLVTGAEAALIHNELVIDGETIVDLGRIRLHVGVSLTISL
jgi:hypothetical protein